MQLGEPPDDGGTIQERRAHIRREHERTLQSDRFVHKQGQTIKVKRTYVQAIWRGPSEATVGQHKYKVILDLPKSIMEHDE